MHQDNETPVIEGKQRVISVDVLRGIVMIIMLLDHTREYVHAGGLSDSPTDLTKTNAPLFFTRWITHFCAPTFVFLSGLSIYLQKRRGKTNAELSRFLLTRGLWLVFVEFTIVRLSMSFNFNYSFLGLAEVIWVFGVSMIVMAGLIYLPVSIVAVLSIAMIALHNLLDGSAIPPAISILSTPPPTFLQSIWLFLHQPGFVPLLGGATRLFTAYPLIPWIGVMGAGYAAGRLYDLDAEKRRRTLFTIGAAATILFLVLRYINVYGDPSPWQPQPDPFFTFLSYLNTTKYPASLLFLLMTLGPAMVMLAVMDRWHGDSIMEKIALTYGRVPLFYFILQMFVAHGLGLLLSLMAGKDVGYLFMNFPDFATNAPPGNGFPLWAVYLAWVAGLIILYPICAWYGLIKMRSRNPLFSYL